MLNEITNLKYRDSLKIYTRRNSVNVFKLERFIFNYLPIVMNNKDEAQRNISLIYRANSINLINLMYQTKIRINIDKQTVNSIKRRCLKLILLDILFRWSELSIIPDSFERNFKLFLKSIFHLYSTTWFVVVFDERRGYKSIVGAPSVKNKLYTWHGASSSRSE